MTTKNNKQLNQHVLLVILDGWGVAPASDGNAISQASTPFFDSLIKDYPATVLAAAGPSVGLSSRITGNCEAGHQMIGTGAKTNSRTKNCLASVLAQNGISQLRIADSEKIALVTYFFDSQRYLSEKLIQNLLVPSLTIGDNANRAEALNEAAAKITVEAIERNEHGLIVVNLGGPDTVGHSGDLAAVKRVIESTDRKLEQITAAALNRGYLVLVTADHGFVEQTVDLPTDINNREHTKNPVPLIIIGKQFLGRSAGWIDSHGKDLSAVTPQGSLMDVAPTILSLFNITQPVEMTGHNLIADKL